ncbi:MAG: arylsulfatase, partial [Cellulosilyticaceae bacterium]
MNKPNIVLIMADQFRGDCLGIAGHPDVKTPYLDSLAARGVRFSNAYTACPSCVPARAALLTGLTQRSHGRVGYQDRVTWNYEHTLAGELTKAGYYTQCVGKMHVHPLRNYMGFHHVELHDGYLHNYRYPEIAYYENQKIADDYFYWLKNEKGIEADVIDTGVECNSWIARPWIYEEKYHPTNWVVSRSIDFLRRRDHSQPFFLKCSFVRPHAPFDAPKCYLDMYENKELTPPVIGDWADEETYLTKGRVFDSDTGPVDKELIRQMQVGYYASITHMDHQVGRLVQALIEQKLYNNTIIIFTADHGELLGDHHTYKKIRPYKGSINIPFIVSGPPELVKGGGETREAIVELRDVLPTTLDIAGYDIPEAIEGQSVMPLIVDENKQIRDYLHGEHSGGILSNQYIVTTIDKFIWFSQTGKEQYFRLDKDPYEKYDLIEDKSCQERINELRNIMIKELEGREEGYSQDGSLVVGQKPTAC